MDQNTASADQGGEQNIKVVVRVRPPLSHERVDTRNECVEVLGSEGVVIATKPQPKEFYFDHVAGPQSTQFQLFETVGKPISERILAGYNGTIFAYGQTSSGKTHTMQGPLELSDHNWEQRGLIPRVLDYLFDSISKMEDESGGKVRFLVKCSYLEIYNERLCDLLNPEAVNIMLQEDINQGVKVVNLSQEIVSNSAEALDLMELGSRNRRVACTAMNRQSSRSHSVFTLYLQSQEFTSKSKIKCTKTSSFNLIDLAGSERQRDTGTTGDRLREAGRINRSLSALGNVITALVDIENGKKRHVRYRDSKLTFLLKDSIGGNSLTYLVAAISPCGTSMGESLSTLKFAARAKNIRNQARINQFDSGNAVDEELLKENQQLREKIFELQEEMKNQSSDSMNMMMMSDYESRDDLLNDVLRQTAEYREALDRNQTKIEHLEELGARLDQQDRSNKLVRKMLKKQIQKLHDQILSMQTLGSADVQDLKSVLQTHFEAHDDEIRQFEQQLLTNPEVLRHLIEKEDLMQKLEQIDASNLEQYQELESFNRRLSEKCVQLLQDNDQLSTECEFLRKNAKGLPNDQDLPSMALLESQNSQLSQIIETLREKLSAMEQESFSSGDKMQVEALLQKEVSEHENQIAELTAKHEQAIKVLEQENASLKTQLEALQEKSSDSGDVSELMATIEEIESRNSLQETLISQKDVEVKKMQEMISSLNENKRELTTKLSKVSKESALKSAQYEEVVCQLDNIQEDHECLVQQVCYTQGTCQELELELTASKQELERAMSRIVELESSSSNSHDKAIVRQLEQDAVQLQARIRELEQECEQVESLQIEKGDLVGALSKLQEEYRKLARDFNEKLAESKSESVQTKDVMLDLMIMVENAQAVNRKLVQENKLVRSENSRLVEIQSRLVADIDGYRLGKSQAARLLSKIDDKVFAGLSSRESILQETTNSGGSAEEMISKLEADLRKAEISLNLSEFEKRETAKKCQELEEEIENLEEEMGKLAGHQNPGQKIQMLMKVKQENNQLKSTVTKLEKQIWSLKKKVEINSNSADRWSNAVPLSSNENAPPRT